MTASESVRVSPGTPVWHIEINRPEARNAVDGPTAAALADAFRAFEADPHAAVAVLSGAGGGYGLVGMRERAAMAGGSLEAAPRPTGGFRVAAGLPLQGAGEPRRVTG